MPSSRRPWKQIPRDIRGHRIIEEYLRDHGADSEYQRPVQLPSHRSANEGRLTIRRGATHYGVSAAAWVSLDGQRCADDDDCQDPQAEHLLTFVLYSKARAQRHVAGQAKGEPAGLKYNPYARRQ
jgi:hypothetical protein